MLASISTTTSFWRQWLGLLMPWFCLWAPSLAADSASSPPPCPVQPFAIPLRNCTFDSGVVSWGALVEVGTPGQRLCLAPSTVINSTLVSQQSLCAISDPGMSKLKCESLRGGFFNENQSSTWTGASLAAFNSTRSDPTWAHFNPPGVTRVGYDTLHFPGGGGGSSTTGERTLYGFGLALNERGNNSNAGMLGLGISSLFLDTAVRRNVSGARGWSLYSGSQSAERPRSGELVFGGYNAGRLDGSLRWRNVSDMAGDRPCPLRTTIADMYITLDNGTQVPLKSSGELIAACIEPYDNLFRFTPGMLLNWKQLTGFDDSLLGVYAPNNTQNLTFTEYGLPYNASRVAPWSLTVALDNGYTTTLPPHELQAPMRGWNRLGERAVVPGVVQVAILDTPTGRGEIPTLGKIFLSQTYLAVDYDNRRFGLAHAALEPETSKLVPFGCAQLPSAALTPSSSSSGNRNKASTSVGVIVGCIAGGLALIAIAIVAFFFWRRRRRNTARAASEAAAADSSTMSHTTMAYPYAGSQVTYHPSLSEGGTASRHGRGAGAGAAPAYGMPSPTDTMSPTHQAVMQWEAGSQYGSRRGSPPPMFGEVGGGGPDSGGVYEMGHPRASDEVHELSGSTEPGVPRRKSGKSLHR